MKFIKILLIIFILLVSIFLPKTYVSAADWYYPISDYNKRLSLKNFGILIDDKFYKGKESLFPYNRFYGYHAAADLEVFANENKQNVPVYTVHKGKIIYIGSQTGYGGVILQTFADENLTVLYGHVKVKNLNLQVGDEIAAGQVLTYLGDAFSSETSKERKHLHFGIYKGGDLYFRGHEDSREKLLAKWIDPTKFLASKNAAAPNQILNSPTLSTQNSQPKADQPRAEKTADRLAIEKNNNIFHNLIKDIKNILKKIGF